MANKKNKGKLPKKILLCNDNIQIECSQCSFSINEDCEECNGKGFTWQKVYTGKTKNKDKFVHSVYKLQKNNKNKK